MKWNWGSLGSNEKVCFLCASKDMKDHGYLEYSFKEKDGSRGRDKKEICALCCSRVETSNIIKKEDEDG